MLADLPAYANGQRFVSKGRRERAAEEYSDPRCPLGSLFRSFETHKGGGNSNLGKAGRIVAVSQFASRKP
jgi:hypothetical protein